MPGKIHQLDEATSNLIAAGEVVERPASVVKELVENSLDAGAGRIAVEVEGAGNRMIRVSDDGEGMEREDVGLAFCRHATSKISGAADLKNISTMGFRGEALPSIASVSRFELVSCTRDNPCGTRIVVEGGETVEISDVSRAQGTTATVRSLFFNVPARRKFLKSDQTELRHIIRVVTCLAVAQIETGFKLTHEGRELLAAAPCGSVAERVRDIFGVGRAGKLLPVIYERGDLVVGGLIADPDSCTGSRPDQYLFINRRPFTSRSLAHAVRQGYRSAIPDTAQPSFFLFLTVRPDQVDINVHPSKLEVRFRDEGLVYAAVQGAVKEGLRQEGAVADYDAQVSGRLVSGSGPGGSGFRGKAPGRVSEVRGRPFLPGGGFQTSLLMPLSPEKIKRGEIGLAAEDLKPGSGLALDKTPAPGGPQEQQGKAQKAELQASALPSIWQLHGRYIFVETKKGCLIIDQHAAHERVLFEQIMTGISNRNITTQRLLFPLTLELSPEEHSAALEFKPVLEQAGFEVEEFGGRTIVVRATPALKGIGSPEEYFGRMLHDLISEGRGSAETAHQCLARSLACRAAVKSGRKLSSAEMNDLIDRLFATELPYADVHGRNTIVQLSLNEIDKRFGRN
ncbi:MAG: DNA mismatch repair endonuclease MutL [Candidatus Glassbacteria bacterium]|nr:DNA mismatch repair endonuclease MutL [Candidatus Glassbacteria bacterium]